MQRPWSAVALATVWCVSAAAGTATAQTVVVRNAPPAMAVEVVLNAASVATGAADAAGVATLPFRMKDAIGKVEIDANVFVDLCESVRRVVIVEIGGAIAPPGERCDRRQISGLYWVRPVNTIVVNLAGTAPSLLLVKGSYGVPPPGTDETGSESGPRVWRPLPRGLVIGGGAAFSSIRDAKAINCGTVVPCDGGGSGLAFSAGATYWITRYIGVEGMYLKPKQVTARGGDGFTFDSTLDTDVWGLSGVVGVPAGPVRFYGKGGMNYHQGTAATSQTIGSATQTFGYRTKGFGWMYGGGLEGWVSSRLGIFGEAGFARIQGDAEGAGEELIDDRLRMVIAGIRIRIGG